MKNFTQIIESRGSMSSADIKALQKDLAEYNKKMSGKMPEDVTLATAILSKYSVYDQDSITGIAKGTKSDAKRISNEFSIDLGDMEQLQFLLKKMDKEGNIRLIPMMMSKSEREDLMSGRKTAEDITMDLETEKGRTAVVNTYKSLVTAIANKFVGKCGLDRGELTSAGLEGLVKAMNSYRRPGTEELDSMDIDDSEKKEGTKVKGLTFRQYAGWCIRNSILSEINTNSRTVRINSYQYQKMKDSGDMSGSFIRSIDQMNSSDENERIGGDIDRIPDLGVEPDVLKRDKSKDDEYYAELYNIIDKKFPTKKSSIFYRIFGVNGYQQVSARTIGAEMGISENRVSQIKKEIILYILSLKDNPKAMDLLDRLREMYTESLVCKLYSLPKNEIYESLISDDFYMLLETVTKWDSKDRLSASVSGTLEKMDPSEADYIVQCLKEGFDFVDSTYRKNKELIMRFLSAMEPTETFNRRSDAYILDKMSELSDMCKKYKLYQK